MVAVGKRENKFKKGGEETKQPPPTSLPLVVTIIKGVTNGCLYIYSESVKFEEISSK